MNYIIAAFIAFFIISTATVVHESVECSKNGGVLVKGISFNGYVCVEEKQ